MVWPLQNPKTKIVDKARIIKIDIDKNPAIASSYNMQSEPTLVLFKNGKAVWHQSGVMPAEHLKKVIEQNL